MNGYVNKLIMYHEIHQRSRSGWKPSQIASCLGLDTRTVNKYLAMSEPDYIDFLHRLEQRIRKLDAYEDFIKGRLEECPDASAAQVHDWLKEQYPGFRVVSSKTVYSYVQSVRQKYHLPKVFSSRIYQQVKECAYGQQVQVDFGEYPMTDTEGHRRKVYFMAMVLSRSRYKFVSFSDRPFTTALTICAHEEGFAFFGGYPREVVYDQDKLLLKDENLGQPILTEEFRAYHLDRGFQLHFCRKADPESKGKIENVVKYVKYNFLRGRTYYDLHTLNAQAIEWLSRTGNANEHSTIHKIPSLEWELEKLHLQPLQPSFRVQPERISYTVSKTNVLIYQGCTYSLPVGTYQPPGTDVLVERQGQELVVFDQQAREIARQPISPIKGVQVRNNNHFRDPSQSLTDLIAKTAAGFSQTDQAVDFLEKIRQDNPRYARDQIRLIARVCARYSQQEVDQALEFCLAERIWIANDFEPVLLTVAGRQVSTPETAKPLIHHPGQRYRIVPQASNISDYNQLLQ